MASGSPPLLPLTTATSTSRGHGRHRITAAKACCLLIFLLFSSSCILACRSKPSSVITFHRRMSWWLQGEYDDRLRFHAWLQKHPRSYITNSTETDSRFRVFRDNLRHVDQHNAAGNHSYRLALNNYADVAHVDQAPRRSLSSLDQPASDRYLAVPGEDLPVAVDWRLKGAVGPVRNQLDCGSCWAIAAVQAVEGIRQIVTGEDLVPLSAQELIDCDEGSPLGCYGGFSEKAMEYVMDYGVHAESEYSYVGERRSCQRLSGDESTVRIASYEAVPARDERSLQKAVAGQPVAVAVDGSARDLSLYESGVYTGPCSTQTTHEVLVVGYGSEAGKDYWILKNSLGEGWGEGGYIRMERNSKEDVAGKCGIATEPIYPHFSG